MHLINDALQSLTAPLTGEQLEKIYKNSLGEIEVMAKETGVLARNSGVATKVEQIMNKVVSGREEMVKGQDQKFLSLIESFKNRSGQAEQTFKPGTMKVVAPVAPSKEAARASFKEYLSFAQNSANAGKIILGVRGNKIESGRCILTKQKDNDDIAVIGDDQVFSGPINDIYQETKTLRAQITTLGKQIGIEGGARNKKVADQVKLLEQKARDLVAQLHPLKKHSNADVQNDAFYVEGQLHNAIDEVGQLLEATQQNRNILDGLGLETKPWHGEPLSVEEGKAIIGIHETWRDVGDDHEVGSGKAFYPEAEADIETSSDDEIRDDGTDTETVDRRLGNLINVEKAVLDSPKSLSSRGSSMGLRSDDF